MKFKEKFMLFLILSLLLLFSYSICSTHELPSQGQGYISKRKRFCATPIYFTIIAIFVGIFLFK